MMQKPPPCYQNWDVMAKVSGGRLCTQCNKTIVDFSKKTWEDILEIQKKSQFTTCGKYSEKQIRHWGHQPPAVDLAWFRKFSFTGMLVLLGLKSVDAQVLEKVITEHVLPKDSTLNINEAYLVSVNFHGKITSGENGEALVGAMIRPKFANGGAFSDENGAFTLSLKVDTDSSHFITVLVSILGFQEIEVNLKADTFNSIDMTKAEIPDGIYFRVQEPTFKYKLLRPFRRLIGRIKSI